MSARDPRPVYSEVMEDGEAIAAALEPRAGELAVCVASAGDNVFRLALDGARHVFGVDSNPAQIDLCRLHEAALRALAWSERAALAGAAPCEPAARLELLERVDGPLQLPLARDPETREAVAAAGLCGCGRLSAFVAPLRELLAGEVGREALAELLEEPARERREALWEERFATPGVVELLGSALNRDTISDAFIPASAFDRMAEPAFHLHYHRVLRRLCVERDPTANRFLHRLWLGRYPSPEAGPGALPAFLAREHEPRLAERLNAVTWHAGDVLDLLRGLPDASVHLYNLSNVLDWSSAEHYEALWIEVDRTAADGARLALRSFLVENPPPRAVVPRWALDERRSRRLAEDDRVGYFSRYELWVRSRVRA